jgi:hypothetical protein
LICEGAGSSAFAIEKSTVGAFFYFSSQFRFFLTLGQGVMRSFTMFHALDPIEPGDLASSEKRHS